MLSERLSSFVIVGWIFFSWSLLLQNPLIPCMLQEALADQQTDIAPAAESHTATVSTFTQRSGSVTSLGIDVSDPGVAADYLSYELVNSRTTNDVIQQVSLDLTSLGISGSQIDEITFKGQVFLTGGWNSPGPENDPFECGNVGDAYVQIYNGTSWENVGSVVIPAETGFNNGSGGGTAALYDAEGLTFTRTRTGGFTDSYLDISNILQMRFYWADIDCSVGQTSSPDAAFIWDYTLVDVTYTTVSVPEAPILYDIGGTGQLSFNNVKQHITAPRFRASATHTSNFDTFFVELNTRADFAGAAYTQTFSNTYTSGTQYDLLCDSLSPSLPATDGVTYYVRARASANGGSDYGTWSADTWSFTYNASSDTDPIWYQATDAQFDTGTLFGTETFGADQVRVTQSDTITLAGSGEGFSAVGQSALQYNYSLQTASGNNRLLVVAVSWEDVEATASVDSIQFNSVPMNEIATITTGTGYYEFIGLYYLLDSSLPSSPGSYQLSITTSETITQEIYAGIIEYNGVLQSVPDDFATDANASAGVYCNYPHSCC